MGRMMLMCVINLHICAYTSDIFRYLTFSEAVGMFHYCTFLQTATNVNYPPMECNVHAYTQYTHLYLTALTYLLHGAESFLRS